MLGVKLCPSRYAQQNQHCALMLCYLASTQPLFAFSPLLDGSGWIFSLAGRGMGQCVHGDEFWGKKQQNSATHARSAGVSITKFRPSVIYLRQLSSLAPSGAAFGLLLAFLLRSPPVRMVRCGGRTSYTHALPVKAYSPFALPPCWRMLLRSGVIVPSISLQLSSALVC